jgi:hypothetical protein
MGRPRASVSVLASKLGCYRDDPAVLPARDDTFLASFAVGRSGRVGLRESKIGLTIFNSAAAERECGAGRALSIVNPLACLVAWAIARKVIVHYSFWM